MQTMICQISSCKYRIGIFCSKKVVTILPNGMCKELTNVGDGFSREQQEKITILNIVKRDGDDNGRNYDDAVPTEKNSAGTDCGQPDSTKEESIEGDRGGSGDVESTG